MTEVRFFFALILFVIGVVAFGRNKDFFSPIKIYTFYSTFFYLAIFYEDFLPETLFVYFSLLASIALTIKLESKQSEVVPLDLKMEVPYSAYYLIWLLTIPGMAVISFFIIDAGGISQYFSELGLRVKEWEGKGHLIIWFYIIPVLHLIYFCYFLVDSTKNKLKTILFIIHFLVFVLIGLLSGSRSYIAIIIVGMVFCYSYIKRRISLKILISVIFLIIILVGVIGVGRDLFGNDAELSDNINTALTLKNLEITHFKYGLIPLELIFSSELKDLHYGSTYLSLLTNFFPRSLFPEKLVTGGLILTREYANDAWGGYSHLATGSVTEAIINFGYIGIIFGMAINFSLFVICIFWYNKIIQKINKELSWTFPIDLIIYFYFLLLVARISYAEFTDVFQSFIFYSLGPCVAFKILIKSLSSLPESKVESNFNR